MKDKNFSFNGHIEKNIYCQVDKEEISSWLYIEFKAHIQKIAYYYIKDTELAKDISQEVIFICCNQLHTLKGEDIKPWINRITVNKCIDVLRKREFKQSLPASFLLDYMPSKENSPEYLVLNKLSILDIIEGINQLPYIYKEVMTLYYLDELSYIEISNKLQLNYSTIKTRLHRGKVLLKKYLQVEGK